MIPQAPSLQCRALLYLLPPSSLAPAPNLPTVDTYRLSRRLSWATPSRGSGQEAGGLAGIWAYSLCSEPRSSGCLILVFSLKSSWMDFYSSSRGGIQTCVTIGYKW